MPEPYFRHLAGLLSWIVFLLILIVGELAAIIILLI